MIDIIGWLSTGVLVLTVGKQALKQWKDRSTAGVSHWLFIGQMCASVGFVIYSALLGNAVFAVSNVFLLLIALAGQIMYVRNRRREKTAGAAGNGQSKAAEKI